MTWSSHRRSARWIMSAPLVALALLVDPAGAAEPAAPMPGWQHINCMCRANGQRFHVGERVCLSTPAGRRMAECRMSQNVTNWAVQSESCDVSAGLPAPSTAAAS